MAQSVMDSISGVTDITYNCINAFDNPMPAWTDWDNPWMFRDAGDGWDAWLAASPGHQVILSQDLIPQSASKAGAPLAWEQACADGDYDQYAATLAKNLVSYGAGNTVIRLGLEANGSWEPDYVGTTNAEMNDWAECYADEVSTMRAVSGAHFLFVWNPNICTGGDIPLSMWYPGNAYVDIIGADAYDKDCSTLKSVAQEGWEAYYTDSSSSGASDTNFPSLANIVAFAAAHGKPMSFPEWGVEANGDDPSYVDGMAKVFETNKFAFQSYFDNNDDGIAPLGASILKSTEAYAKAFK